MDAGRRQRVGIGRHDAAVGGDGGDALPQADFAAWLTARELSELALSA
jgi:hypothetical protein